MISRDRHKEAYVWAWLPGAVEPVVAGHLVRDSGYLIFNYGQSYLECPEAIPLYLPELPLEAGAIPPEGGLVMAGCLRDASPDAWGRRVILNNLFGIKGKNADVAVVDELTYLLESGSDRIGALDFQLSPTEYVPRTAQDARLDELQSAADKIEAGIPFTSPLDQALLHGSSLGGARPKVMIEADGKKLIAKFSLSTDPYNVVKAEFIAMRLAARVGLSVAPVRLEKAEDRDVLLVERFDRLKGNAGWQRRAMVSALTILERDERWAYFASYAVLAEAIRHRFTSPKIALRELFGRLVFNILCGNTDDHARNHAAFWDGSQLTLTPAYDICPQRRAGNEAEQAMWIVDNNRRSTLATCMLAAYQFLLDQKQAYEIIKNQLIILRTEWDAVCDEACLSQAEQGQLWGRMFYNPSIFHGAEAF